MAPSVRPLYELLAEDIRALGVECAFGLMSDDTARLVTTLDALGLAFHGARHENTAVAMAEGYAAASGRMGLAIIGRGPALANAIHGATYARRTGSPVLLLFGEAPLAAPAGQDGKAFDAAGALHAAGIPVHRAVDAAGTRQLLHDAAMSTASSGAVALLLPADLQLLEVDPEGTAPLRAPVSPAVPLEPSASALAAAADLVQGFRKPLIIAGRGAHAAGARDALIALGDHIGAALACTVKARSLFNGHPADCGIIGSFSHSAGRRLIEQADGAIVFGAGLNQRTTSHGHALPAGIPVVHVDHGPDAIGRWFPADLGLVGDARLVAERLRERLPARQADDMPLRSEAARKALAGFSPADDFRPVPSERTVDPRSLALALDAMLPAARNTVYDSGNFLQVVPYVQVQRPEAMKLTADFSSIGMGFGTALGFARGSPDRPTVLFIGDGSFLMTLGELETVVREGIPLVIVVMNDCAYGAELHFLKQVRMPVGMSVFPDVDFAPVAQAFGFEAATVRSLRDLEAFAPRLAQPDGPILLDCKINASIPAPFLLEKR